MFQKQFQLNKVRRLINTYGETFSVRRPKTNEFGEPLKEFTEYTIRGLYHETSSYVSKTSTESSTIRQKSMPMILCILDELPTFLQDDVLLYKGKEYRLGEVKNVSEAGIIGDISLEEVQKDGNWVPL